MKKISVILLLVAFILAGCGAIELAGSGGSYSESYDYEMEMPAAAPAEFYYEDGAVYDVVSNALPETQQRMVIENADLSIVIIDPQAKMDAIAAMAERLGGFVVSSNLYET